MVNNPESGQDPFDRITQVQQPSAINGGNSTAYTHVLYPDSYWTRIFHDKNSSNDQAVEDQFIYDGFGRQTVHRQIGDSQDFNATYTGYL